MYQSVIRDPGGDGLIRIQPDVCDHRTAIVNGSRLIVPPGTTAFVALNGQLSRPYAPGSYQLFTGVDPFFVRLRNLLSRGDTGTSVSVFFVATEKSRLIQLGTGEFPFRDPRFHITLSALASCSLTISVSDPLRILQKLVGTYSSTFSEDDLQPWIEQLVLGPVRESLATEIGKLDLTQFNRQLTHISQQTTAPIRRELANYGLRLERFAVTAINVPEREYSRLRALEEQLATGKLNIDLEEENLKRIWGGRVSDRTLRELLTGIPGHGQQTAGTPAGGQSGGMMSSMLQMMLLSQLLPTLREPMMDMTRHTDLFGGGSTNARDNTATPNSPPPMPGRLKTCPSCNGSILRTNHVCPICGYRF